MPPQERNILLVYILSFVTFGIYFIYWLYKTKNELNELGANIPSFILFFIPIANIYWLYKYTEGWAYVTKKDNTILYFILFLFVSIIMPYFVQKELNQMARNYGRQQMMGQGMPPQQYPRYPNYPGGQGGQFRM
jgi:bacteriorhodopsin